MRFECHRIQGPTALHRRTYGTVSRQNTRVYLRKHRPIPATPLYTHHANARSCPGGRRQAHAVETQENGDGNTPGAQTFLSATTVATARNDFDYPHLPKQGAWTPLSEANRTEVISRTRPRKKESVSPTPRLPTQRAWTLLSEAKRTEVISRTQPRKRSEPPNIPSPHTAGTASRIDATCSSAESAITSLSTRYPT